MTPNKLREPKELTPSARQGTKSGLATNYPPFLARTTRRDFETNRRFKKLKNEQPPTRPHAPPFANPGPLQLQLKHPVTKSP
jgi:hypothetical protein